MSNHTLSVVAQSVHHRGQSPFWTPLKPLFLGFLDFQIPPGSSLMYFPPPYNVVARLVHTIPCQSPASAIPCGCWRCIIALLAYFRKDLTYYPRYSFFYFSVSLFPYSYSGPDRLVGSLSASSSVHVPRPKLCTNSAECISSSKLQ
jgi:hypothetical protein